MAKSKAAKAEKRMQREEDEAEVRALDERLKAFMAEGAFRSLMRAPGRPQQLPDPEEGDAEFDLLQAQLRHDRRGGVRCSLQSQKFSTRFPRNPRNVHFLFWKILTTLNPKLKDRTLS